MSDAGGATNCCTGAGGGSTAGSSASLAVGGGAVGGKGVGGFGVAVGGTGVSVAVDVGGAAVSVAGSVAVALGCFVAVLRAVAVALVGALSWRDRASGDGTALIAAMASTDRVAMPPVSNAPTLWRAANCVRGLSLPRRNRPQIQTAAPSHRKGLGLARKSRRSTSEISG